MTITVNPTRNEYTATASQAVFNYTFKIFAETDLNVYQTLAGNKADDMADIITTYTVTGVGDSAGGTIILTTGAAVGDLITIVSDIPETRSIDYQNNGDFVPGTVNDDFDKMVSLVKQVEDFASRTLLFQESEQGASGFDLPSPVAGEFLRWNPAANGVEGAAPNLGLGDMISANNLSDVTSPATSRVSLGLGNVDNTSDATKALTLVGQTSLTGAAKLPAGTTVQRPSGVDGYFRFNATLNVFEGYKDGAWGEIGGASASGGGTDQIFVENDQNVTTDYTVAADKNAMSTGPITVDSGVTVTIASGARWVIL